MVQTRVRRSTLQFKVINQNLIEHLVPNLWCTFQTAKAPQQSHNSVVPVSCVKSSVNWIHCDVWAPTCKEAAQRFLNLLTGVSYFRRVWLFGKIFSLTSVGSRSRCFTQDNLPDLRSGGPPRLRGLR